MPPVNRNEPDVNVFLNSLLRFYAQASNANARNLNEVEYYNRHAADYLDSIQTLAVRAEELASHSGDDSFVTLANDILHIVDIVQALVGRLEQLQMQCEMTEGTPPFTCPTIRNIGPSRPKFIITQEQLEYLRELGFNWQKISELLGVSARTVRNVRHELGMAVGSNHDNISDLEVDREVRNVLAVNTRCGQTLMRGALMARGWRIQVSRIRASLQRVDPVGVALRRRHSIARRTYNVPAPNSLW